MLCKIRQCRPELQAQASLISAQELKEIYTRAIENAIQEIKWELEQEQKIELQDRLKPYQERKQFMRACLEKYRTAPEESWVRNAIDSLVIANREIAGTSERNRIQHNAIVLRYIVKNPLPDTEICKRLYIRPEFLETRIDRGIEDFLILLYGIDGINPIRMAAGCHSALCLMPISEN